MSLSGTRLSDGWSACPSQRAPTDAVSCPSRWTCGSHQQSRDFQHHFGHFGDAGTNRVFEFHQGIEFVDLTLLTLGSNLDMYVCSLSKTSYEFNSCHEFSNLRTWVTTSSKRILAYGGT